MITYPQNKSIWPIYHLSYFLPITYLAYLT